MTANRVAVEWRGPRGLRQEETEPFTNEMSQIVDMLERGPEHWTLSRIDFLDDPFIPPIFVWRLELPTLRKEWCPRRSTGGPARIGRLGSSRRWLP